MSQVRLDVRLPQSCSLTIHLLTNVNLVSPHLLKVLWNESTQDSDGEQSGVSGVVDADGGGRNASLDRLSLCILLLGDVTYRHLNNTQKRVHAVQVGGLDGNTNDGKGSVGGDHAGEMGSSSCSGNDNLDASVSSSSRNIAHFDRCSVSRRNVNLPRNAKLSKNIKTSLENREIRVRAHGNQNQRILSSLGNGLFRAKTLALSLNALLSHISCQLDKRLSILLELLDASGQSGEGDVTNLAAGLGLLSVEVGVDADVAGEHGLGLLNERDVGFWFGAAEDVDHDAGCDVGLELFGEGLVENRCELRLVLRPKEFSA